MQISLLASVGLLLLCASTVYTIGTGCSRCNRHCVNHLDCDSGGCGFWSSECKCYNCRRKNQSREFKNFSEVCPLTWVGYTPSPDNYRIFVGVYEVACSIAILISDELKTVSTAILAFVSIGAVFIHVSLGDTTSAVPPTVTGVLFLILFIRSYVKSCVKARKHT